MSRFNISIEDDSSTANPDVIAAVAEIPETQVEVQKSAADVAMQSADVATCVSDIQTGQDSIGTLSDIQQVLVEASTKTEGIDETTAVVTQIAVEAIYARLGMKAHPLPAMEVFASKHSRQVATKIAVESIGSTIKRIWEAIIKALQVVVEKIRSFFKSFAVGQENLAKSVKQLRKEIEAIDKDTTDKEIPENICKSIAVKTKGATAEATESITAITESVDQLIKFADKASDLLYVSAKNSISVSDDVSADDRGANVGKAVSKLLGYAMLGSDDKSGPILDLAKQRAVFFEKQNNGFVYLSVTPSAEDVKVKNCKALTKQEMLVSLSHLERVVRKLDTVEKVKSLQEKTLEILIENAKKFSNGPDDTAVVKDAQIYIRYLTSLSNFVTVGVPSEVYMNIKTVLTFINASKDCYN